MTDNKKVKTSEPHPLWRLDPAIFSDSNPSSLDLLGDWSRDPKKIKELARQFQSNPPFPHVVIENFWKEEVIADMLKKFPSEHDKGIWWLYNNPIERKLACDRFEVMNPLFKQLFEKLNSPEIIDLMKSLSGIDNLEGDPFLHGGGLHCHPTGGKLDMHLDYSIHPHSGKERRLNLIAFLNKDWKEEYGGHTEFWNAEFTKCVSRVAPFYNRVVLFRTNDLSYHGLPDPLTCPKDLPRRSFALYYVSDPRPSASHRMKASYFARPSDPKDPEMDKLRVIRRERRLNDDDCKNIKGWDPDWGSMYAIENA